MFCYPRRCVISKLIFYFRKYWTNEPHQQRCNMNCLKFHKPECPLFHEDPKPCYDRVIILCGCASHSSAINECLCDRCSEGNTCPRRWLRPHSSAVSERDKVLDELEDILKQRERILNTGDGAHKYTIKIIREKMAELRSQKGEQE